MSKTILVTGSSLVPSSVIEKIEAGGFRVVHRDQDNWTADELHEALRGVQGYMIGGYEEPTADHFERANDLEVVAWVGTDYRAYVPGWKRAMELGIAFVNTPGANANAVAELTVTLMLICARRMGERFATLNSPEPFAGTGEELRGKTLGIIGLGRIGSLVASIASSGIGMKVIYLSKSRHPKAEAAFGCRWVDRQELLRTSDVVTLHRPGIENGEPPELSRADIFAMKRGAILINTVKWNMVELEALHEALALGQLGSAAFDGIGEGEEWEKLAKLGWGKFVYFPQTGFNTTEANERASSLAATAVMDVLNGRPSDYVNNPDFASKRRRT